MATYTVAQLSLSPNPSAVYIAAVIVEAALNYWNGQYFMQQVVYNAGENRVFQVAA
jgi:membrane protein DedA with SNARE-associated domain